MKLLFLRSAVMLLVVPMIAVPSLPALAISGLLRVCKTPDMLGINYVLPIRISPGLTFADVGRDLDLTTDVGEPWPVTIIVKDPASLPPGERACVVVRAVTDQNSDRRPLSPRDLRRFEAIGITDSHR
jgi:hypothetical protein